MTVLNQETERKVARAEEILGYRFKDKHLLAAALTHPSAAEADPLRDSYERLEFLGDSYLDALIAEELYTRFQDLDEGGLTRIKVSLVSGDSLSRVASELGFSDIIVFGGSERGTGRRGLHSALENVYESVVAALFLDGGREVARMWVLDTLGPFISKESAAEPENPKSTLQELFQARHITPTYRLVSAEGPPHDRMFTSQVLAESDVIGEGSGRSKKEAEMHAAKVALVAMGHA